MAAYFSSRCLPFQSARTAFSYSSRDDGLNSFTMRRSDGTRSGFFTPKNGISVFMYAAIWRAFSGSASAARSSWMSAVRALVSSAIGVSVPCRNTPQGRAVSTAMREEKSKDVVVISGKKCRFQFNRLRPGVLLVTIGGYDDGELGTAPLDEMGQEI